jgi:hypothetical protein
VAYPWVPAPTTPARCKTIISSSAAAAMMITTAAFHRGLAAPGAAPAAVLLLVSGWLGWSAMWMSSSLAGLLVLRWQQF